MNILSDPLKNDDIKDSWPKKPYVRKKMNINILIIEMFIKMNIYKKLCDKSKIRNPLDPIINYVLLM